MAAERPPLSPSALDQDIQGLDALDVPFIEPERWSTLAWRAAWPKLAAVGIVLAAWELIVLAGWRPTYVLPSPWTVLAELGDLLASAKFWSAVATTMRRAATGFALAIAIGTVLGVVVSRSVCCRRAFGLLHHRLQRMRRSRGSPCAIMLFKCRGGDLFVIVIGAFASIANGLIHGIDTFRPAVARRARLGARGFASLRHVVLPRRCRLSPRG